MKIPYILLLIVLTTLTRFAGFAQTVTSKTGYECIGDNREYFSPYGFPQTILASRISQDIEFNLDSSCNFMTIGGSYLLIHGANQFHQSPIINAYYSYTHRKTSFKLGSFPMPRDIFPHALYTDSLYYFRPNMQGALLSFSQSFGLVEWKETGILDWMLQENYGANESFIAGVSGELWYRPVVFKHQYYYRHHAKDTTGGVKAIEDNGCLLLTIGFQSSNSPVQLSGDIGKLITWQKFRFGDDSYSGGLYTQAQATYHRISLEGVYYYGDPTYLPMGDPLYRSGNYARIDASIRFIDAPRVQGSFGFCSHIIAGEINYSQQLSLTVHADKIISK